MTSDDAAAFVVLLPVKRPAAGKTRLAPFGDVHRRALAEAFALDTAAACLAASRVAAVLVATDDAVLATRLTSLGCAAVPDGAGSGLNPALVQAAAEARRRWPELRPAALLGDLPALRSADLDAALAGLAALAPDRPGIVADAAGTGTTLYSAPYDDFAPAFGPGSRGAHLALGAVEVTAALPTLRQDVDDPDDLTAASTLGLGAHTAALLGG